VLHSERVMSMLRRFKARLKFLEEPNTLAYLAKVVFCIQLRTGVRQKIFNLVNQPDNVFIKFGSKIVIRVKTNDRYCLSKKKFA